MIAKKIERGILTEQVNLAGNRHDCLRRGQQAFTQVDAIHAHLGGENPLQLSPVDAEIWATEKVSIRLPPGVPADFTASLAVPVDQGRNFKRGLLKRLAHAPVVIIETRGISG